MYFIMRQTPNDPSSATAATPCVAFLSFVRKLAIGRTLWRFRPTDDKFEHDSSALFFVHPRPPGVQPLGSFGQVFFGKSIHSESWSPRYLDCYNCEKNDSLTSLRRFVGKVTKFFHGFIVRLHRSNAFGFLDGIAALFAEAFDGFDAPERAAS